jgi:hypothetical protein
LVKLFITSGHRTQKGLDRHRCLLPSEVLGHFRLPDVLAAHTSMGGRGQELICQRRKLRPRIGGELTKGNQRGKGQYS